MTNFTVGSLVKARGREWVVLPELAFTTSESFRSIGYY